MEFLPPEDIRALLLVEKKKIFPAAQQVITNRSQKFLEILLKINPHIILNFNKEEIKEKYQFFKEQAETFPAGTEKRCESLREAICSLFENYADGSHLALQYCLSGFNFYEDKFFLSG
jgi:hypothetical protein